MNIKANILLAALLGLLGLAGCSKESPFPGPGEGSGSLSTKSLMLNINNTEIRKGGYGLRGVELADFIIDIKQGATVVASYRYADMPGVIELPVGDYTAVAHLGDNASAAWSAPYYSGSIDFSIRKDEITEAATIECRLANVRVSIIYSDELKALMADDAAVQVVMGADAALSFAKTETRSGYFAYVAGSNTLAATFSGLVDGVMETSSRVHTDVEPGTHYRITYTVHKPGGDPNASGHVVPGVTVDATVEVVNLNFNVDPGEDPRPNDDDRPTEGGDTIQPPHSGGPNVTIEAPLSFEAVNQVTPSSNVVVHIKSETGITAFTVDIVSTTLTPELLGEVGLSDHLDLVSPGALEEGIAGLGLPVNVGGQKDITFNISGFMPLLAIYGENDHKFILKVADASGQVTKILQLHIKP